MHLDQLVHHLDEYLQVGLFKDYCPNGLQVEGKREIKRLATAVSASRNIINQAVDQGFDALITHHGLFWEKDPYVITGAKKEKIGKLLKGEVSLLAYHLPLDAHPEIGNNWKAAKDLGWSDLEPFGLFNGIMIGVKGRVKRQSAENFRKSLEDYYQHKAHCAAGGKELIESCALISGGAYKAIDEAAKVGVDCFISGNFDEPAWHLAHEEHINYFALGHAATEKIGPKAMAKYIQEQFQLETVFIDEINPF